MYHRSQVALVSREDKNMESSQRTPYKQKRSEDTSSINLLRLKLSFPPPTELQNNQIVLFLS